MKTFLMSKKYFKEYIHTLNLSNVYCTPALNSYHCQLHCCKFNQSFLSLLIQEKTGQEWKPFKGDQQRSWWKWWVVSSPWNDIIWSFASEWVFILLCRCCGWHKIKSSRGDTKVFRMINITKGLVVKMCFMTSQRVGYITSSLVPN